MVEIRTFAGDMRELSTFCSDIWRRRYDGQMPYLQWSPDFFEWELAAGPESRDYLVAAYDGARLVGVLPARPMKFHLRGAVVAGTWGSYFSVDPDYEKQPVALKLNLEQRRRHRERGAKFNMGFVFGNRAAKGKDFWLKQTKFIKEVRRLGLWTRILDHRAVARFSMHRLEVWGAGISRLVLGGPAAPRDPSAIRPFAPSDAAECAALLDAASRRAELGYVWDETLAARQLSFKDVSHTHVALRDGQVAGLVNFACVELIGRAPVRLGVIDFLVTDGLASRQAVDLVRTALKDMQSRGVQLAVALRVSGMPWWPLARTGFTMMPREYTYVAQPFDFELPDWHLRRLHVHWR